MKLRGATSKLWLTSGGGGRGDNEEDPSEDVAQWQWLFLVEHLDKRKINSIRMRTSHICIGPFSGFGSNYWPICLLFFFDIWREMQIATIFVKNELWTSYIHTIGNAHYLKRLSICCFGVQLVCTETTGGKGRTKFRNQKHKGKKTNKLKPTPWLTLWNRVRRWCI